MKLKCPNGCKSDCDTPFVYSPYACGLDEDKPELGVLAYANAQPSNRWCDGTIGVPACILEFICAGDDFPLCVKCHEEAEWSEATLADHAEAWWREQGKVVPPKNTEEWDDMYRQWVDFAFADFRESFS